MKRWIPCLLLIASPIGIAAEADLPCQDIDDPAGLSTLCGFAKPEDLQFVRSRSVVIVSEQGWKAPASGGSISIVDIDGNAVRFRQKRTVWPAADATVSAKLIGDTECKA